MKPIKYILLNFILLFLITKANAFMFWNQACDFTGTSQSYVAVVNSASLDITGSFSLEAWIRPDNSSSPSIQIIMEKRGGAVQNGYALAMSGGKLAIITNGTVRLLGKSIIQSNAWTHVAGTFMANTSTFKLYIDNSLDTTAIIPGVAPVTNSDSLRIGKGNIDSSFNGYMDEVRIWKKPLTDIEVARFARTSLGASTGIYTNLAMSITFQKRESAGFDFVLADWSGNGNHGKNNGVNAVDLSNRPSNTISYNESIELNGTSDYLFAIDNPAISPVNAVTLEAWIFPQSNSGVRTIMHKGTPSGGGVNYSLLLNAGVLEAVINGMSVSSSAVIPLNLWSHVAFTYNSSNGKHVFFINSKKVFDGSFPAVMINNGTENLFIGSNGVTEYFDGFIDEVRISNYIKSQVSIAKYLYQSIDLSNEPSPLMTNVVYNLDGYAYANADSTGPILNFVSGAAFSHPGVTDNQPVSPIDRSDQINFPDGFNFRTSNKRIPVSGSIGSITDSLKINLDTTINDINVYVALNHDAEEELEIIVQAPNGQSVTVYLNQFLTTNSDNVITVFDDNADSSIAVNGKYVSFSPRIKPKNNLNSVFAGDSTLGIWKLIINDAAGAGAGRLISWGIQFNSASIKLPTMAVRVFMQGFYRPLDSCVTDTIKLHLRENTPPYHDVGIHSETPDDNYLIYSTYDTASFDELYYLQIEHRNSIETWSASPVAFDFLSGTLGYDFTVDPDSAFGSNQIQVDLLPRYAMFGGDIDQNDFVELSDIIDIFNDARIFASGYIVTDVTGDNYVDLSDLTLTFNNSNNFIGTIRP